MTVSDVITVSRKQLRDKLEPNFRWPTDELISYLNDGLQVLRQARPDLFLSAAGSMVTVPELTLLADTFTLDNTYKITLASYVSSEALLEDSDDNTNLGMSDKFRATFNRVARFNG